MKAVLILGSILAISMMSCKDDLTKTSPSTPAPVVQESVSGEVSGVWTAGGTYKITNHVQVSEGKSLTIQEGVTVLFSDSTVKPEFIVKGNLYVLGTAQNTVKFTVPDAWKTPANQFGSLWGGITCGPKSDELLLQHAIIEYGGAVTTENSASVKAKLYKARPGEHIPAVYYANVNGKVVITNNRLNNQNEDGFYLEGGKAIVANNLIYTLGVSVGDAINIKSGVLADVAFNTIYSPNTNAIKLANTGERNPQAYIVGYNNTIINAGWRRPIIKGGSIWLEEGPRTELYNNLLVNSRFGVKRDVKNPEDKRSLLSNNYYYSYTQQGVDQFQPNAEVLAGTNDILGKKAGENDPKFLNFPLDNPSQNATFNSAWDFSLQSGSPALGKGRTDFSRNHAAGFTLNGTLYKSPEPATYVGAKGAK